MRPRFVVLAVCGAASLLAAAAGLVLPATGQAAPHHNRGLTINVTPNPILAGDPVLIYGQLNNPPVAGQTVILYHHLAGSGRGYTKVSQTTTDGNGFYSFPRAEDVVLTNRSWYVREAGLHGVHSRTVYERVAALVSLAASQTNQVTNQPIVFTGHVTPDHPFERVSLQVQNPSSGNWSTVKTGFTGGASNFQITYRWRTAGERDVRVAFPGDARNVEGASDPVTVTIQQKQIAGFTINSSSPIIDDGQSVNLTGVVSNAPSTQVALFARTPGQTSYVPVAFTTTGADGSYSFTQSPTENTRYQVRTTAAPKRHSAVLFQGVRDNLTMTGPSAATVGEQVTFTGTVLPDQAGHVIYLERLGRDGDYHVVEVRWVSSASTFAFTWRFGSTGTKTFRARITSDQQNIGNASAPPVTVTVGAAPTASLPKGS